MNLLAYRTGNIILDVILLIVAAALLWWLLDYLDSPRIFRVLLVVAVVLAAVFWLLGCTPGEYTIKSPNFQGGYTVPSPTPRHLTTDPKE